MRRMDELHLDFPFAGSRTLRNLLTAEEDSKWPSAYHYADEADEDLSEAGPFAMHITI